MRPTSVTHRAGDRARRPVSARGFRSSAVALMASGMLAAALAGCGSSTPNATGSPSEAAASPATSPSAAPTVAPTAAPPSVAPPVGPFFEFTDRGTVVGPETVGLTCCGNLQNDWPGVSDETAITLPDGRVRLYFNKFVPNAPGAPGKQFGILSAISADGITFTAEAGVRIGPDQGGQVGGSPYVYRLPDGRYRLYYLRYGAVQSSTSKDGLKFTPDPGTRLTGDAFGKFPGGAPVLSAIVPLAAGGYRGYFSLQVELPSASSPGKIAVYSATSKDLLAWVPEPGVRLGPGSNQPNDAGHPTVLRTLADGTLLLVYHSYDYEYVATEAGATVPHKSGTAEIIVRSSDGLTFTDPIITGVFGAEVAYAEGPSGGGFLYYGRADVNGGARIGVATIEELATGPAINFVDPPFPTPPGQPFGINAWTSPGATCSLSLRDASGAPITNERLAGMPVAGENGLVTWGAPLPPGTAPGMATATVTCVLGAPRTREMTFEVTTG